jgi:short-subunit dehydrogenase
MKTLKFDLLGSDYASSTAEGNSTMANLEKHDEKHDEEQMKKVVVITGASSGNGRAAALAFAKTGGNLVLASRNLPVLQKLAEQCFDLGSHAIAIQVDTTDSESVQKLAREAEEHFGRIDVWVNNAGVGAFGKFSDVPIEAHDQVVRTNLMGYIHGCYAVLPYFKAQGKGIIINTNSVGAWVPLPYATAYSASKFGLRGFMDALRGELMDYKDIHVCDVYPAFVNTPGTFHAANYTGKELGYPPGASEPETVGAAMVRISENPTSRTLVNPLTTLARVAYALAPAVVLWGAVKFFSTYLAQADAAPITDGNLYGPVNFKNQVKAKTSDVKLPSGIRGAH